jgi:hypothetical protein
MRNRFGCDRSVEPLCALSSLTDSPRLDLVSRPIAQQLQELWYGTRDAHQGVGGVSGWYRFLILTTPYGVT